MYKSLLRKIEFLAPLWKVSPAHFLAPTYSPAHMRLVSLSAGGVFSQHGPTKVHRVPHGLSPPYPALPDTLPVVKESGERGEPRVKARPWLQRKGPMEVTSGVLVKQVGEHLRVTENLRKIVRILWQARHPRRFPTVTP